MLLLKNRNFSPKFLYRAATCAFLLFAGNSTLFGQLSATFATTENTICNGSGCNYSGPSILINEIFIAPNNNTNGSLYGPSGSNPAQGEWIELYNPNVCEPIDISCYYLGNNANDNCNLFNTGDFPGGYVIPAGTIVPPAGFCIIRGSNAPEIPASSPTLVQNGGNVVQITVAQNRICIGSGCRLWFPDAGSWFAFYDYNGVPQDAISWATEANIDKSPCVPAGAGCSTFAGPLPNYNQIAASRKTKICNSTVGGSAFIGKSFRRIPDGGAWETNVAQSSTQGLCNATCASPAASSCTGTATVTPAGGTAPYTYEWDDTQGQLTQTAVGLCAGTYTVEVTDNVGATASFSVEIEDLVPVVTLDIVDEVCIDLPAFLLTGALPTATAGQTGVLSGTGLTGANFNPQVAGAGTQQITYVFTDENGCTNSATDQITVNPLPVLSITGIDDPYCISSDPEQFTLSPAGGTYTGPGISGADFVPSVAGVGTHTLTYSYTDGNGCANSTTASVEVVPLPTPSITAPANICSNAGPITLQGSPAGGIFSINTTQTNVLDPATIGAGNQDLSYDYTDANGCQALVTDQIEVFPVPNVTLIVTPVVCIDAGNIVVSTSPPTSATGTGVLQGDGITGNNFSPTTAGNGLHNLTYTFTTTDGCINTATDDITVNPLPVVSITGVNPTYCLSNTPVIPSLQPAGGTLSGPGVVNNTFIPSTAGVGTHTLTYSFTDANSCSSATTVTVQVVAVPSPTITTPDFLCNYAAVITLVGTPAGGVFTVDGTQTPTFNPSAVGDGMHAIVYTYTDANSCLAIANETIDVLPRPALSTNLAAGYCFGTQSVPLTLSPAGGTLTGDFVSGTSLNLGGANPGSYSITYNYTDASGCENTLNSPFVLTSPLHPHFSYSTDCFQNTTFHNETLPGGNYMYAWEFIGTGASAFLHPTVYYSQFGDNDVILTVTDSYGCVYDTTATIFVTEGVGVHDFVIPNVITANGDGVNDVIALPIMLEECITYKILILNRWGNLVYEMNGAQNAFGGKDKGGKDLQEGVYFYIVESDDIDCSSDQYKGFCSGMITVVR